MHPMAQTQGVQLKLDALAGATLAVQPNLELERHFRWIGKCPSMLGAPVETDSSQEGSSLCEPAGGPRPHIQLERCRRQLVAAPLTKLDLPRGVESGHIATRWTHSERKRFPPVVKTRMRDSDRERAVIDRGQPSFSEKLRKVTVTRSGELGLAFDVVIEFAYGTPEEAEWSPTTVMIPHASSHYPSSASHPGHLP